MTDVRTWGSPAPIRSVDADPVPGDDLPVIIDPPYCVRRAAAALDRADEIASANRDGADCAVALVEVAEGWRDLASAIAARPGLASSDPAGDG